MQTLFRQNDLDPGGESVADDTEVTSQSIAIPPLVNGDLPRRARFAIAGAADVFISVSNGAVAVTIGTGLLITRDTPAVVLKTGGHTHFNHIASATGSTINVTPLNE